MLENDLLSDAGDVPGCIYILERCLAEKLKTSADRFSPTWVRAQSMASQRTVCTVVSTMSYICSVVWCSRWRILSFCLCLSAGIPPGLCTSGQLEAGLNRTSSLGMARALRASDSDSDDNPAQLAIVEKELHRSAGLSAARSVEFNSLRDDVSSARTANEEVVKRL